MQKFIFDNVRVRTRGYLPHWEADNAYYSITYRLNDSIRRSVLDRFDQERRSITNDRHLPFVEKLAREKLLARRFDEELDRGSGTCALSHTDVAALILENARHFDGGPYRLLDCAVMPNHVHAVMFLLRGEDLDDVLFSWKSYTGKQANRVLGRRGRFWEPEYYDRLIRDSDDLRETREYVANNPRKAGLLDWPWTYRRAE